MDLANDKFDPERFGLITGSACHVLFPDKGDGKVGMRTYAKQLANNMYFRFYDEHSTWQMQHGNMNEHEAFLYYQTNYDFEIEKGYFVRDGIIGGTSDALGKTYGADFKCPTSLDGWLDYIHVGITKQQFHQAQMYMRLFKKDLWKVCAYLTETEWMVNNGLVYPVPEDKRMIIVEVQKDETWDERLKESALFVIQERDKFYTLLCKQFGNKVDYKGKIAKGKKLLRVLNQRNQDKL